MPKPIAAFVTATMCLALPLYADEEMAHIWCLSARAALEARDFDLARGRLEDAAKEDPGSTEVLLLRGELADASGKGGEAAKQYGACLKALLAKRVWTGREVEVRRRLTLRLLDGKGREKLGKLVEEQAEQWLDVARALAGKGASPAARAAAHVAESLDPTASGATAVADRAADGEGWTPLLTATELRTWRQARGTWQFSGDMLACKGDEGLLASPAGSSVRDLRLSLKGGGKAVARVDVGRFAISVDFAEKKVRARSLSPAMAFHRPLGDGDWHRVALLHRSTGVEVLVDGARVGFFEEQRVSGIAGIGVVGQGVVVKGVEARAPVSQVEERRPSYPWEEQVRRMPRTFSDPDDLIAAGRGLEAILKLTEGKELIPPHVFPLLTGLEERGMVRWAMEVCDAAIGRGGLGELAGRLVLHRAHLALRAGDAAKALKLAAESKDASETTLVLRGDALHRLGKKTEAAAAWRAALKRTPLRDDVVRRLKAAGAAAQEATGPIPLENAIRLLKSTVVIISGLEGGGSGFFLRSDGLLLTNWHVAAGLRVAKVTAVFQDGEKETRETYPIASVVAADPKLDLAAVRVIPRGRQFIPARLSGGGIPAQGSGVLVIGSPGFGDLRLDYTATQGIVSSGLRELLGTRYVQTDAAINPGNSGGPVFDQAGRVVGVATAGILFAQNLGFFVPSTIIRDFLKREGLQ